MNILFVGDLNSYSRTSQRKNALVDLGHSVIEISTVSADSLPGISSKPSVISRLFFKFGYPIDSTGANEAILESCDSSNFDILWIEKGLMILPKTLEIIKTKYPRIKIVSYTEDDMFYKANQSKYYLKAIHLYDIVFTTKSYNAELNELPSLGAKKVIFVDKAYDKSFHKPVSTSNIEIKKYGSNVGFIGTFEEERALTMLFLAQSGIEVRIFGNGWKSWKNKHKNLKVEDQPLYDDEYIKGLCATKINLCFLRKINRDLQTDRTMEIPACGAFMLAERTQEHERLFEEDKEASFFDVENPVELLEKIKYFLKNEDELMAIGKAGRARCISSGYSHHDRLLLMLQAL